MTFDYGLPADLFMLKRKVGLKRKAGARQRLGYRRFATAAEAIRFAVEDFPAIRTLNAWRLVLTFGVPATYMLSANPAPSGDAYKVLRCLIYLLS